MDASNAAQNREEKDRKDYSGLIRVLLVLCCSASSCC